MHADRCFFSLADTWRSSTTLPTDVKELIPEFYSADPSFLVNALDIKIGARASGVPMFSERCSLHLGPDHVSAAPYRVKQMPQTWPRRRRPSKVLTCHDSCIAELQLQQARLQR